MIGVGCGTLRAFDRPVCTKPLARCVGNYLCVFKGVSWVRGNEKHRLRDKPPSENCDSGWTLVNQSKSSTVKAITVRRHGHTTSERAESQTHRVKASERLGGVKNAFLSPSGLKELCGGSGVPAPTSVRGNGDNARERVVGNELQKFLSPIAGEERDRAEVVCCVFDWRASRSSECAESPLARGVVGSGPEIPRK
jgi:hypothetical protein